MSRRPVHDRELTWRQLPELIVRSQIAAATTSLPPWGLFLLVMAGLLVAGCVMETTAALPVRSG